MTMLEKLKKYLDSKPIEELQKEWDELAVSIAQELEKSGYNILEGERSNETVDDNIQANGYTFDTKGNRMDS